MDKEESLFWPARGTRENPQDLSMSPTPAKKFELSVLRKRNSDPIVTGADR